MIVSKRNSLRLAAVSTFSALVLGAAGTAMAAAPAVPAASAPAASAVPAASAPAASAVPAASAPAASAVPAASVGITAKPSVTSVQAWRLFRVAGTTTGLKAGSAVTLQQKQHGTWVALPASVHTTRNGSYSLGVKLGIKGLNELRIISGNTASPVFTVTVR